MSNTYHDGWIEVATTGTETFVPIRVLMTRAKARRDEQGGTAGVREPRTPKPPAPLSGAISVELPK